MHLQVVSPFRGLQLISIISRKRCTQQLVMLHNISTFFSLLEHTEFKCKVGNDGNREDMSFMASILGWCVEIIIFFSPKFTKLTYQQVGNCYARLNFCRCSFLLLLVAAFIHLYPLQSEPLLSSVSSNCLFTFGVRWCHDSERSAAKHSPTHEVW